MIVCRNCGHSNPDGTAWCQKLGCGVSLDSAGAPQPIPPVSTVPATQLPIGPPPTQPAPPTTSATPDTPPTRTTPASAAGSPVIGPPPRTETTGVAWPPLVAVPVPVAASDSPAAANSPEASTPAPAPAPAPTEPVEPAVPTEPVEPAEPAADLPTEGTPTPATPTDQAKPIDPSDPTDAAKPAEPAGDTPPEGTPPPAGVRKAGRGSRGILVALVLAVVAVAVVVGGYFYLTNRNDKPLANGSNGTPTPTVAVPAVPVEVVGVSIGKVSSSATYNGVPRPAKTLLDGKASTFWSASYRDKKPTVRFAFTKSQTVARIDIVNGAAGRGFIDRPSAKDITVTFPDGRVQTVQLEDELGTVQSVVIDAPQAGKWVEILVNSVYDRPHGSNNMYLRTSIADVAFFSVPSASSSPAS